ncbi:methyl-accepting chemotaxis protein [Cerasicoccus frondis]|uniref:methyl-accepting chemotaxis protein n=1 Tax=Cerasicoccus frondis TaxID=490090 RepID=UPI0028525846|nr:methyl-accepting chemotaxis protein [Cerasicoccus frondis]
MERTTLQFRSIRSQIIVCVALPVVATIALICYLLLGEFYNQLEAGAMENINLTTERAAQEIDKTNLETISFPKAMAFAQKNGMFGQRHSSIAYARDMLAAHPQLTGSYFGYEPNADGADTEFLETASEEDKRALEPDGRFLPYWYRDHDDDTLLELEPLVDMEESFYYQGAKNLAQGASELRNISFASELSKHYNPARAHSMDDPTNALAMVTEPYVYEGKLIVEQTYPIVIDGEFKGIAGVDRALAYMQSYLTSLKQYESAEFTLISKRGRIIASTVDGATQSALTEAELSGAGQDVIEDLEEKLWKAKRIEDIDTDDTLLNFYKMHGSSNGLLIKGADGVERFYDAAKIPTGDWTLVMSVNKSEIYEPVNERIAFLVAVSCFGVLATLGIMVWLANNIAQRISHAAKLASRVADGDLTAKVEVNTEDETGTLLRAIKTMIGNLNILISQVKGSSMQLTSTATKISSNAKTQQTAVNEFESSTNSIAAAVKEISTTSQELSNTMSDVTNSANETKALADSGRKGLEEMEKMMNKLAEANDGISGKLSVISERAKNVNRVITTITTVADQTNLLSLNAAIEAEKAGEYGLGFSVVAREIRRLSDQTAVATLDIEQMIKEMHASVDSGVVEMEHFSAQMKQSVTGVQAVSNQLASIIKHVQELTVQFGAVKQGMDTQSVGAHHIDEAMLQLKDAARATTASISGFNQATMDLQQAVKVLRAGIDKFDTKS